jgi:hypothetical protein
VRFVVGFADLSLDAPDISTQTAVATADIAARFGQLLVSGALRRVVLLSGGRTVTSGPISAKYATHLTTGGLVCTVVMLAEFGKFILELAQLRLRLRWPHLGPD